MQPAITESVVFNCLNCDRVLSDSLSINFLGEAEESYLRGKGIIVFKKAVNIEKAAEQVKPQVVLNNLHCAKCKDCIGVIYSTAPYPLSTTVGFFCLHVNKLSCYRLGNESLISSSECTTIPSENLNSSQPSQQNLEETIGEHQHRLLMKQFVQMKSVITGLAQRVERIENNVPSSSAASISSSSKRTSYIPNEDDENQESTSPSKRRSTRK